MIEWKKDGRLEVLSAYVDVGLSVPEIAQKMKLWSMVLK